MPMAATEVARGGHAGSRRRKAAPAPALVIAYSGGPDSSALLDLACRLRNRGIAAFGTLRAVHVHHGLQPQAEEWIDHCQRQCRLRDVELTVCRVQVAGERGTEAGAREARYTALAQDRFGKGVKALNKLEASGLIEELLEQTGQNKGNNRGRFQGRYQRAGAR